MNKETYRRVTDRAAAGLLTAQEEAEISGLYHNVETLSNEKLELRKELVRLAEVMRVNRERLPIVEEQLQKLRQNNAEKKFTDLYENMIAEYNSEISKATQHWEDVSKRLQGVRKIIDVVYDRWRDAKDATNVMAFGRQAERKVSRKRGRSASPAPGPRQSASPAAGPSRQPPKKVPRLYYRQCEDALWGTVTEDWVALHAQILQASKTPAAVASPLHIKDFSTLTTEEQTQIYKLLQFLLLIDLETGTNRPRLSQGTGNSVRVMEMLGVLPEWLITVARKYEKGFVTGSLVLPERVPTKKRTELATRIMQLWTEEKAMTTDMRHVLAKLRVGPGRAPSFGSYAPAEWEELHENFVALSRLPGYMPKECLDNIEGFKEMDDAQRRRVYRLLQFVMLVDLRTGKRRKASQREVPHSMESLLYLGYIPKHMLQLARNIEDRARYAVLMPIDVVPKAICDEHARMMQAIWKKDLSMILPSDVVPAAQAAESQCVENRGKVCVRSVPDDSDRKHMSKELERARRAVLELPVAVTGARPGELLLGCARNTKQAQMKVASDSGIVGPLKKELDAIRKDTDLWNEFLDRLGRLPFFSELGGRKEREAWLLAHQVSKDSDLADQTTTRLQLLFSGAQECKLNDPECFDVNQLERLMDPDQTPSISGLDFRNLFFRDENSTARRHTHFFILNWWKVENTYSVHLKFTGHILDTVSPGAVAYSGTCTVDGKSEVIYVLNTGGEEDTKIGIRVVNEQPGNVLSTRTRREFLERILKDRPDAETTLALLSKLSTSRWTAASWKSLVQKIVRTKPATVRFPAYLTVNGAHDVEIDAGTALAASIVFLLAHPGCFVPDIQRFVSGAESALKRTAIIAIEDSYVTEDAMPQVAQMAVLAFLSQRVPSWRPGWSHVQTCVQTLIRAWREPRCFTYSVQYAQTESTIPFGIQDAVHSRDPWAVLSAITDQLRSFAADLQMLRGLARHPEKRSTSTTDHAADPRRVMHLAHCVDQHWAPDIVYFFTPQTVLDLNQPGAKPFGSLLNSLFVYLTGVNPRRRIEHVGGADFRDAFCTEAQQAQQLWLKYRLTTPVHQTVENKQTDVLRVRYTLDRGWLAALVGSIRVGRNGGVLATLRASDPTQIVVVKKPSRDMKSLPLSDKDQENALAEARTKLEHGIRWASKSGKNAIRVPLEEWKKALVKRVGDNTPDQEVKYMIHIDGGNDKKDKHIVKEWDELRHLDIKFPVFDGENPSTGLLSSARQRIEEHIRAMPSVCQHALQSMLSGYHLNLQMPRVGRDGGGTQGAVSAADVGVFHFLRELARLAPAALVHEPGNPTGFTVVCGPLLWYLRDTWMTPILTAEKTVVVPAIAAAARKPRTASSSWAPISYPAGRVPWKHQSDSVDEMLEREGRGQFIWIPMGLGKTSIVLDYAVRLRAKGRLPRYIIYLCPTSAIATIVKEAEAFGFGESIKVYVPLRQLRKADKESEYRKYVQHGTTPPRPFCLTIIEHDHVRRCQDVLTEIMHDSLLIIDEVHKALYETQRTAACLHLSHLAHEFVAMTGTPVVDANTYRLSWWLERVASFPVTPDNFWVAVGEMIAKKVNTGVHVEYEDVEVKWTSKQEEDEYRSLIPVKMGGTNANPSTTQLRRALELDYAAVTREMARLTGSLAMPSIPVINDDISKTGKRKTPDTTKSQLETASKHRKLSSEIKVANDSPERRGVFVVTRDEKHRQQFLGELRLPKEDVFNVGNGNSIFLTHESVHDANNPVRDYSVVTTTKNHSSGYSVQRLNVMITSVYPMNVATQQQLEGRINRIGQRAKTIRIITVHRGLLTLALKHHKDATGLLRALESQATDITALIRGF